MTITTTALEAFARNMRLLAERHDRTDIDPTIPDRDRATSARSHAKAA